MNDPYAHPEVTLDRAPLAQRLLGVVTTLLLIVGLAAVLVGKDAASADPVELLGSAPDAVREAGSVRIAMTMSMTFADRTTDVTGSGLIDFASQQASFTMTGAGFTIEEIVDGDIIYLHLPDQALPGIDTPWIGIPVTGDSTNQVIRPDQATSFLDSLHALGDVVVDLGPDEIDDRAVHHYAVSVDLGSAVDRVTGADAVTGTGAGRTPIDVWLGDDGLPVRMAFAMGGTGAPFTMKAQIDFSDYGVPVQITPPPADQVHLIDPNVGVFGTTASFSAETSTSASATQP